MSKPVSRQKAVEEAAGQTTPPVKEILDVKVRRARKEDMPDIIRLLKAHTMEGYGIEELPAFKLDAVERDYEQYYLGFVEGKLAGIRALDPEHRISWVSPDGSPHLLHDVAYLKDAFTLPEYRRSGVSTAIEEKILEDAKQNGITEVYVATKSRFMVESRLKRGFTLLGENVAHDTGVGETETILKKDL